MNQRDAYLVAGSVSEAASKIDRARSKLLTGRGRLDVPKDMPRLRDLVVSDSTHPAEQLEKLQRAVRDWAHRLTEYAEGIEGEAAGR